MYSSFRVSCIPNSGGIDDEKLFNFKSIAFNSFSLPIQDGIGPIFTQNVEMIQTMKTMTTKQYISANATNEMLTMKIVV